MRANVRCEKRSGDFDVKFSSNGLYDEIDVEALLACIGDVNTRKALREYFGHKLLKTNRILRIAQVVSRRPLDEIEFTLKLSDVRRINRLYSEDRRNPLARCLLDVVKP